MSWYASRLLLYNLSFVDEMEKIYKNLVEMSESPVRYQSLNAINKDRKRAIEDITVAEDDDAFTSFYSKLKKIKETHKTNPISYLQMHLDVDILQKTKEQVALGNKESIKY